MTDTERGSSGGEQQAEAGGEAATKAAATHPGFRFLALTKVSTKSYDRLAAGSGQKAATSSENE